MLTFIVSYHFPFVHLSFPFGVCAPSFRFDAVMSGEKPHIILNPKCNVMRMYVCEVCFILCVFDMSLDTYNFDAVAMEWVENLMEMYNSKAMIITTNFEWKMHFMRCEKSSALVPFIREIMNSFIVVVS